MKGNNLSRTAAVVSAVLLALSLAACSTSNGWLTDYDEAKRLADRQGKNILLFVTGEDWDGLSTTTRTTIFEAGAFMEAAEKDYVLVQLDFSQSSYAATEVAEDATEEQKAAAQELLAKLERDTQVAMELNATSMTLPVVMLLTKDGYVFQVIAHNPEVTTPEQYVEVLNSFADRAALIQELAKEVESSRKEKKAAAIDALYNELPSSHQYLLQELVTQVPQLDPDNTTGVVGKYEVLAAYAKAIGHLNEGDALAAAQAFTDVTENGHLNNEEKQYMYYMAASFYNMLGADHTADVVDYLQKAYDVAPDTAAADSEIRPTLDTYKRMLAESQMHSESGAEGAAKDDGAAE